MSLWVGAGIKFEDSLGYFLGPRQLEPFLLGVGCQADFLLSQWKKKPEYFIKKEDAARNVNDFVPLDQCL